MTMQSLPILTLSDLNSATHKRDAFIATLQKTCHEVGFFYLRDFGVSKSELTDILAAAKCFFDLPLQEKLAISIANSRHYRGYGVLDAEITEGVPDHKETLDLGLEQPPRNMKDCEPYLILQGPNQWPSALGEAWRQKVLRYIAEMQRIGRELMQALSTALGLNPQLAHSQLFKNTNDAYAMLRMLCYPAASANTLGVGPHIDAGCLVLLLQDEVGGLEVQRHDGSWLAVPPIPGTLVVNIGAMLQEWSDHYFLATPHRVFNSAQRTRYSVPFFFEPNLSSHIEAQRLPTQLQTKRHQPTHTITHKVYGEHMLDIFERSFPKKQ